MSKFINLSDGNSDGFVLFYLKNGVLNSVLLTEEQAQMLDVSIAIPFIDKKPIVAPADDVKRYLKKGR